jgi:hypothetical protein
MIPLTPSSRSNDFAATAISCDASSRRARPCEPLQQLVEQRRGLVGDKVRITNRVTYALKQYLPQALD